jgi:hypothetical protein
MRDNFPVAMWLVRNSACTASASGPRQAKAQCHCDTRRWSQVGLPLRSYFGLAAAPISVEPSSPASNWKGNLIVRSSENEALRLIHFICKSARYRRRPHRARPARLF